MTSRQGTGDGALPDVVYIVRPGDNNEELRYSLRTLTNVPHNEVWIAGHVAPWLTNVRPVPVVPQRGKYETIRANLCAAVDQPDLDRFVLFNDDFFVMEPVDHIPMTHRGPWSSALKTYHPRRDRYAQLLRKASKTWPDGLCYDSVHTPMPMEAGRLRDALDGHDGLWRSAYGNIHQVGGELHRDVKWKGNAAPRTVGVFLSTSDISFSRGKAGQLIRRRFPKPSPYERAV